MPRRRCRGAADALRRSPAARAPRRRSTRRRRPPRGTPSRGIRRTGGAPRPRRSPRIPSLTSPRATRSSATSVQGSSATGHVCGKCIQFAAWRANPYARAAHSDASRDSARRRARRNAPAAAAEQLHGGARGRRPRVRQEQEEQRRRRRGLRLGIRPERSAASVGGKPERHAPGAVRVRDPAAPRHELRHDVRELVVPAARLARVRNEQRGGLERRGTLAEERGVEGARAPREPRERGRHFRTDKLCGW